LKIYIIFGKKCEADFILSDLLLSI